MTKLFGKKLAFGFSTVCLMAAASVAQAGPIELVTNGNFESYTGGYNGNPSQVQDLSRSLSGSGYTVLTGWTNTAYTFAFAPGTGDTTGSHSPQFSNSLYFWGTGNSGTPKGPDALPASSPSGGNYIGIDPAYQKGALSQTINGLTAGDKYTVSFDWAGAQQHGYTGATWEGYEVKLGSEIQYTTGDGNPNEAHTISNISHGFTGWQHAALTFTATGASETLSFIALGGPDGVPPFAMLDGVSMTASAVPEPSSMALSFLGFLGLGAVSLRRRFARSAR